MHWVRLGHCMAATAGQWPLVLQPGGDVADVLQRNGARSADRAPRGTTSQLKFLGGHI
jgi:hypothetical protein